MAVATYLNREIGINIHGYAFWRSGKAATGGRACSVAKGQAGKEPGTSQKPAFLQFETGVFPAGFDDVRRCRFHPPGGNPKSHLHSAEASWSLKFQYIPSKCSESRK